MTFPASSKTAGNIIDYARRQFGDEASVQITDNDIISWINMGQMDIAVKLRNIQASSSTTVVKGQRQYSIPSDVIKMESVYYNDTPLKATSMDWIQTYTEDSTTTQLGDPNYWWIWAGSIFVYPVPDNNVTTLIINYIKRPVPVVNAASDLGLPDSYYNALCDYVLAKAQELDENLQGSQISKQRYEEALTAMVNMERNESGSFPVVQEYLYD